MRSTNKNSGRRPRSPRFVGDVEAQSVFKANRKGGSVVVTLKKFLADRLNLASDYLAAATVHLDTRQTILLIGADPSLGEVHVIRSCENSIEIVAVGEGDLEVVPIIEVFLSLKTEQFKRGQLNLSGPNFAEDQDALS